MRIQKADICQNNFLGVTVHPKLELIFRCDIMKICRNKLLCSKHSWYICVVQFCHTLSNCNKMLMIYLDTELSLFLLESSAAIYCDILIVILYKLYFSRGGLSGFPIFQVIVLNSWISEENFSTNFLIELTEIHQKRCWFG